MAENTVDRWWQIDALFAEALDLPADERDAFLAAACDGAPDVRREVEHLLEAHQAGDRFLEDPADWFEAPLLPGLSAEAEAEVTAAEGRHVGSYRLLGEIGHGGMGTVYLAERADGQFQQRVALKLLRRGINTEAIRRRFRLERQILASLEHPNIARLLDGGVAEDGPPYFVMEYVAGAPITAYCDAHHLGINDRLDLFRTVCGAVQYAHQNLVVHRDLKPGNILVTEAGEVKLLDFGIAKLLDASEPLVTLPMTQPGMRLMTPEYASPEQIRGEAVTTASDAYALGVLLYELLTGHRPYRLPGRLRHEVERIILEEDPEKPSTAISRVAEGAHADGATRPLTPVAISRARGTSTERLRRRLAGDLDVIVLKALRKEPHRRYTSVEQLAEDLRRHLEGLPVRARRDTLGYRTATFVRRHRAAVAATAAFVVVVLGFAGAMALQAEQTARERDKAEQVSSFLVELFEVSDPSASRGNTVTAREILDKGAERMERELEDQPEVQAAMMDVMGRVYQNLGLYEEATPLLEEALAIRRRLFGDTHPDVVGSFHSLAWASTMKGDLDAAERLYRDVLTMRHTLPRAMRPRVAGALHGLAWIMSNKGDYTTADSLFREALAMRRALLGAEHESVAMSLNGLGWVLFNQGDFAAADSLFRETLAMRRALLGTEHREIATSLSNLGLVRQAQGDHASSAALFREALAMRRMLLGEEHPEVVTSLNDLATVHYYQADYAAAEPLFRDVLALRRKQLGNEHPDVAVSLNNLATVLRNREAYDEAEPLYREALHIARKQFGAVHPNVATFMHNLAAVLHAMGNPNAAEPLYREALDGMRQIWPDGHPRIASALVGLGELLMDRGDPRSAEPLLREGLTIRRAALLEGHREIALAQSALGGSLAALRRYAEAETLLLDSYATLQGQEGDPDQRTRQVLERLVDLYDAWGKPAAAARHRTLLAEATP